MQCLVNKLQHESPHKLDRINIPTELEEAGRTFYLLGINGASEFSQPGHISKYHGGKERGLK